MPEKEPQFFRKEEVPEEVPKEAQEKKEIKPEEKTKVPEEDERKIKEIKEELEKLKREELKANSESREDPKRFLGFEKLTQPNEDIKKIAEGLRMKTEQQTLENVLSFLGENLKHIDLEKENPKEWKKLFNKRTVEEIFETKTSYGCTDTAALFLALTRSCEIPAKFIEGKRIGKSGTHSWAQIFMDEKWIDVDPTQGVKGIEFKPEESEHGPYKIISESLGPSDSVISSYEDWRKVEKAWDYKKNTFKKGYETLSKSCLKFLQKEK